MKCSLCLGIFIFFFLISCEEPGVELNNADLTQITGYEKVIKDPETGLTKKIKYSFKTAAIESDELCETTQYIGNKVYREEWLQDDPVNHPDVYARRKKPELLNLEDALDQVCGNGYDTITIVSVDMVSQHGQWNKDYAAFF